MRRPNGFTIVELAIAIAVILMGVAMVLAASAGSRSASTGQLSVTQLQTVDANTKNRYESRPNYAGLTTASAIAEGIIPAAMLVTGTDGVTSAQLANGRGFTMTTSNYVGGGVYEVANSSYVMVITSVTREHCQTILRAMAKTLIGVQVSRGGLAWEWVVTDRGQDLSTAAVTAACNNNSRVSMQLWNM